jgi:SAM-dependent methyltransferase
VSPIEDPQESLPHHVQCRFFLLANLTTGQRVLDVGCGTGELMTELVKRGCAVEGVEIDQSLVESCRAAGLQVSEGRAERLPVADESFDAIVCSVVLPYTEEKRAVSEWARVLRLGGTVNATYHGFGYGLNSLTRGSSLKTRFYGFRMLANTAYYRFVGHRLPGFMGDTMCQSPSQMQSYYRSVGLELQSESVVGRCMGFPIFLCHRVVKLRNKSG